MKQRPAGRTSFFVGGEESNHDLAVLYTLVASCEKNDVNSVAYPDRRAPRSWFVGTKTLTNEPGSCDAFASLAEPSSLRLKRTAQ